LRPALALLLVVVACLLSACSEPQPVRIGFIGGISGRGADLGINGRNGALLAIEQRNATGGIDGRRVELMSRDDGGDPEHAKRMFHELVAAGCEAVIGPMTSAIALALAPEANEARIPLISPTVTTNALSGKDDYFFRVVAPTRSFTQTSARHLATRLNLKRLGVIYDAGNAAYAGSWLADFRQAFVGEDRQIAIVVTFESNAQEHFMPLAERLLAERIDGILILANSLDAALIAQQVRKHDPQVVLAASEWAATSKLTELGGRAVEGMSLASFLDESDTSPRYLAFHDSYRARFGGEPSFAGLTGFDAANTVIEAIEKRPPDQTLRDYLSSSRHVPGAQGAFEFDRFGDGQRSTFITTVRNGRLERLAD